MLQSSNYQRVNVKELKDLLCCPVCDDIQVQHKSSDIYVCHCQKCFSVHLVAKKFYQFPFFICYLFETELKATIYLYLLCCPVCDDIQVQHKSFDIYVCHCQKYFSVHLLAKKFYQFPFFICYLFEIELKQTRGVQCTVNWFQVVN